MLDSVSITRRLSTPRRQGKHRIRMTCCSLMLNRSWHPGSGRSFGIGGAAHSQARAASSSRSSPLLLRGLVFIRLDSRLAKAGTQHSVTAPANRTRTLRRDVEEVIVRFGPRVHDPIGAGQNRPVSGSLPPPPNRSTSSGASEDRVGRRGHRVVHDAADPGVAVVVRGSPVPLALAPPLHAIAELRVSPRRAVRVLIANWLTMMSRWSVRLLRGRRSSATVAAGPTRIARAESSIQAGRVGQRQ